MVAVPEGDVKAEGEEHWEKMGERVPPSNGLEDGLVVGLGAQVSVGEIDDVVDALKTLVLERDSVERGLGVSPPVKVEREEGWDETLLPPITEEVSSGDALDNDVVEEEKEEVIEEDELERKEGVDTSDRLELKVPWALERGVEVDDGVKVSNTFDGLDIVFVFRADIDLEA